MAAARAAAGHYPAVLRLTGYELDREMTADAQRTLLVYRAGAEVMPDRRSE